MSRVQLRAVSLCFWLNMLDGVDNNESLVNTINIFPSADAVQEFRVQTSVASAEFGRGGGAIINSVVRSGSS